MTYYINFFMSTGTLIILIILTYLLYKDMLTVEALSLFSGIETLLQLGVLVTLDLDTWCPIFLLGGNLLIFGICIVTFLVTIFQIIKK